MVVCMLPKHETRVRFPLPAVAKTSFYLAPLSQMTAQREILIATCNEGKAHEIREIFKDSPFTLRFLSEFDHDVQSVQIHENAKSFDGNALIKALIYGSKLGMLTLADDSGICVDALGGKPGVYSARYSKEGTDRANNEKLLKEMDSIPENLRTCQYVCAVAVYDPSSYFVETVFGAWHGRIAREARGAHSFGYAPIFLSQETDYQKTNAELTPEQLIAYNHRGKAFRQALDLLNALSL